MKKVTKIDCYHIISEPGDMTRYNYICIQAGPDDFSFMPFDNSFKYPQKINYWELEDESIDSFDKVANRYDCSPCVVRECFRTMKELRT